MQNIGLTRKTISFTPLLETKKQKKYSRVISHYSTIKLYRNKKKQKLRPKQQKTETSTERKKT